MSSKKKENKKTKNTGKTKEAVKNTEGMDIIPDPPKKRYEMTP